MRQDSRKVTTKMISMEEYLLKRQAIREKEKEGHRGKQRTDAEQSAAIKIAEIMYV